MIRSSVCLQVKHQQDAHAASAYRCRSQYRSSLAKPAQYIPILPRRAERRECSGWASSYVWDILERSGFPRDAVSSVHLYIQISPAVEETDASLPIGRVPGGAPREARAKAGRDLPFAEALSAALS